MKKFNSPIYPIPPSFDQDEALDLESTKKYLHFLATSGAKVVMTTAGTSQFNLMSLEEVRELNNLVYSQFQGQIILGLPPMSTKQLINEIELLNDMLYEHIDSEDTSLLILFPERYYDDDQIVEYFDKICSVSRFPILVHGNILRKGTGGSYEYSKPLLERLSKIDGFIGMKEEAGNMMHATNNLCTDLEVIVAGGSMKRFWALEPHGATTYLVGVGSFYPQWAEKFYNSYFKNDMQQCKKIIKTTETPLFEVFMKTGWHLSMRTALKHFGFIKNDRSPFKQPTKIENEKIVEILNKVENHEK